MGRLSEYDTELATEILTRISQGESLRSICKPDTMPSHSTVCLWVVDNREGFADRYMRARRAQAFLMAEDIFEQADDGHNDYVETKFGPQLNAENINRSRLRVDTRKWYLSKVLPKIYGEKVVHEGNEDAPLIVKHIGKP